MRRSIVIAAIAVLLAPAALAAQINDSDTAGWQIYRNASGEYEFRYPDKLKPDLPTGTGCTNGDCKALEDVSLRGQTVTDGKITVRNMLFVIQRGINPQHLPVQQWYEALAHRPLNASENVISLGGKTAIRRGHVPDNATYVPLNETDILTIAIVDGPPEWTELCDKVLSTVTLIR
jgi:hypothetical protein